MLPRAVERPGAFALSMATDKDGTARPSPVSVAIQTGAAPDVQMAPWLARSVSGRATRPRASVDRVGERLGTVPAALMLEVDEALRLHLGLSRCVRPAGPPPRPCPSRSVDNRADGLLLRTRPRFDHLWSRAVSEVWIASTPRPPMSQRYLAGTVRRPLLWALTAYVSRVQRPSRHIRPVGSPHDLQLLVGAMRLARTAPLAGRQPPAVRRF